MEPNQVDIVAEYADILQIGTRNMQNYSLLRDVGRVARPVMLKRGYGATVEEWLMAAEYIVSSGNPNVILCERGIRTFETYTRNTMDLAAVPLLDQLTHLPVIVDPSHATGKRWLVKPLAIGGVAVGADGVMVEVHPTPDEALSDAEQQLTLDQFRDLMAAIVPVHEHVRGAVPPRSGRPRGSNGLATTSEPPVARVRASARLRGELRLPGDKSISHRALILAALADGESRIDGRRRRRRRALDRRDRGRARGDGRARRRATGRTVGYRVVSPRRGRPRPSRRGVLDCGNSGTSLRLLSGVLAGLPMTAILDGDDSLRRPPGGSYHRTTALDGRRAPCAPERLPPSPDRGRSYPAPGDRLHDAGAERAGEVGDPAGGASGGGADDGPRVGRDPRPHGTDAARTGRAGRADGRAGWRGGRDGTRRGGGAGGRRNGSRATSRRRRSGWSPAPSIPTPSSRSATSASTRPGARSSTSCARWAPTSTSAPRGRPPTTASASRWPTSTVRSSSLRAVELGPADVAAAIDEIPVLCLAATAAAGTTVIRGAGELRHKESDRIAGTAAGLRALGARIEVDGDDLHIDGGGAARTAPRPTASTTIDWR